jgi:hypothetical protein
MQGGLSYTIGMESLAVREPASASPEEGSAGVRVSQDVIHVAADGHKSLSLSLFPEDVQKQLKAMKIEGDVDVSVISSALRMLAESKDKSKKLKKAVIGLSVGISIYLGEFRKVAGVPFS